MAARPLIFRQHAIKRMFERSITVDEIETTLAEGSVIEDYPTDTPYPSALWLGFPDSRPLHVVVADSAAERIIITVYEPNPALWESDWKTRSKT